jgi:hypothetical protein
MNNVPMRSILCGVFLLGIAGAEAGAALAIAAEPRRSHLEVTAKSGRLSVRAHEAPLAEVLEAVGREAGVRIVVHGVLEAPVTDSFADLPIDQGFRRLSRWHSLVLIYDPLPGGTKGPVLTEVWVSGSAGAPGRTQQAPQVVRHDADTRVDARPLGEREGWTRDLAMALKHGTSTSRGQIVETLVRERGGYAVVEILREAATRDPDPRVRRGAIQVLASMNSPDAVDAVRATLRDPHPGVRHEADLALRRQSRARSSEGSVD